LSALKTPLRRADTGVDGHGVRRPLSKEDAVKKLPYSVKARAFRAVITMSSLIALALAAGAGRKFM
jgi:hypothetical protein